jgi:hypothetical protein
MEFGMDVMPLETTLKSYVSMLYIPKYQHGGVVGHSCANVSEEHLMGWSCLYDLMIQLHCCATLGPRITLE